MSNTSIELLRTYKFELTSTDLAGDTLARFQEVSGIDATYDVIEYREGASNVYTPRKFPGLVKYGNITLKRGIAANDGTFVEWLNKNSSGEMQKLAELTISVTDPANSNNQISWTFSNVWPVKYTGPDLNATSSDIAMETIELAHEGVQFSATGGGGGEATGQGEG